MPSQEPEELVEIKGFAVVDNSPEELPGTLIPVSVKVPAGHPYLTGRQGQPMKLDPSVQVTMESSLRRFDDFPPADGYSREISRAVAEHANRTADLAMQQYRLALRERLEGMRPEMTAAARQALAFYFNTMMDLGASPLASDAAGHAVQAVIDYLAGEFTP